MQNCAALPGKLGDCFNALNCSDLVIDQNDRHSEYIVAQRSLKCGQLDKALLINRNNLNRESKVVLQRSTGGKDALVFDRAYKNTPALPRRYPATQPEESKIVRFGSSGCEDDLIGIGAD